MRKVLVIGDTMLDVYHEGKITRNSPENPLAPVFDYIGKYERLGGACNVAANISTLSNKDFEIHYFGFNTHKIEQMLNEYSVKCFGIPNSDILIKNRYITDNKQVFRVDEFLKYSENYEELLLMKLRQHLEENPDYSLIVVSDYNKGTISFETLKMLEMYDKCLKIADLKVFRSGMESFKFPTTIFKSNEKELTENPQIADLNCRCLITTLGEKGYKFYQKEPLSMGQSSAISSDTPVDVTGAGDVFLASLCVRFMEIGDEIHKLCDFANFVSAEKIKHMGTVCVKREWIK